MHFLSSMGVGVVVWEGEVGTPRHGYDPWSRGNTGVSSGHGQPPNCASCTNRGGGAHVRGGERAPGGWLAVGCSCDPCVLPGWLTGRSCQQAHRIEMTPRPHGTHTRAAAASAAAHALAAVASAAATRGSARSSAAAATFPFPCAKSSGVLPPCDMGEGHVARRRAGH